MDVHCFVSNVTQLHFRRAYSDSLHLYESAGYVMSIQVVSNILTIRLITIVRTALTKVLTYLIIFTLTVKC